MVRANPQTGPESVDELDELDEEHWLGPVVCMNGVDFQ